MSSIRQIAQQIRHNPVLEHAEWLWGFLRKPYHQLLNIGGRGVAVSVGGCCTVYIPPAFCGGYWESYEPETVAALVGWLEKHPTALVLDIGCAIGIFSVVGLFASDQVEVVAFDSDLASLKATERMCQYASGNRLLLVHGFASNEHLSGLELSTASAKTQELLSTSSLTGAPGTTAYICINGNTDSTIPTHSLDGLFFAENPPSRPILLKCDVEGAELLVLRGAQKLLQELSPQLLISVHPPTLPCYGHSVSDVREYLEAAGYQIQVLSIDHEEHWWCEKTSLTA
ncbi:FkbM family methyltransferase [Microcoleus sp. ZQ-A2]|nr:FkbM family methyltransferase [Microcoleus sp. FACHB-1]